MTRVEFFFDLGSPASYLAWCALPGIARRACAELRLRPMLLGAVFKATGNASPMAVPAKASYVWKDLQRCAVRSGIALRENPHFPINTLTLMRVVTGVQHAADERLPDLIDHLFGGMWRTPLNLALPEVLAQHLRAGGFDPDWAMALAEHPATKEALKGTTEEAVARGVFGAPTMFVGDAMYFGQDRLDFVAEALARSTSRV